MSPMPAQKKIKLRGRFAGQWADLLIVFLNRRVAVLGAIVFLTIIFIAITAQWIAPHDPTNQELIDNLLPPAWDKNGSVNYLLGTDHFGRDMLSRLLFGARVSLIVAGLGACFALVLGVTIGLLAGFYGGITETVLMRIVDVFLAFPMILLALSLAAILGPNLRNLVIVMGLTGWMMYARVIRSAVLTLKNLEFISAAIAVGAPTHRILLRHVLPNIIAPALVLFTFNFAQFIIMESALSFLGLGVPPPTPTWGRMLYDGRDYLTIAWWMITFPGLCIMLTALSLNLVGDGLRDALDPRIRRMA
jgi:peptide/nickel transport system permease protein